jgi:hypothetical protein
LLAILLNDEILERAKYSCRKRSIALNWKQNMYRELSESQAHEIRDWMKVVDVKQEQEIVLFKWMIIVNDR